MTTPNKHLTQETRYHISALRKTGKSSTEIARVVGYHRSTISREFTRNTGKRGYRPKQAQQTAQARKRCGNTRINDFEWSYIRYLLEQDLSPEQVHGRLSLFHFGKVASVERIYQFVYQDKAEGGTLHTHLRCQKKRRKRYITQAQTTVVEDKLNNRPRKTLGYLTPYEVLSGITRVAFVT